MFTHALAEADRLGLQITLNDDAGWSDSGGPWVTPDQAMKRLVWTTTKVRGGSPLSLQLPVPEKTMNYYRDVAVIAFPAEADPGPSMSDVPPKFSSNMADLAGGSRLKMTGFASKPGPDGFSRENPAPPDA